MASDCSFDVRDTRLVYDMSMHAFWEFLTGNGGRTVLALAAIVISATIAITIFRLNRKRKSIVYDFLSMTRVVSVQEEMAGRVQVLVDHVPVQDVGIVQIRLTNTGTEPIKASEFVRPITFTVNAPSRIIEASISEKEPASIDAELATDDLRLTLRPTLLNSKDSVVLKLLVSDFDGRISVDSRIEGTELKQQARLADSKWMPVLLTALKIASSSAGISGADLSFLRDTSTNDYAASSLRRKDRP